MTTTAATSTATLSNNNNNAQQQSQGQEPETPTVVGADGGSGSPDSIESHFSFCSETDEHIYVSAQQQKATREKKFRSAGAALVVQRSWRSHHFRSRLEHLRIERLLRLQLQQEKLQVASATVIQSKWRSMLVQKELWSEYSSAVMIQGQGRTHLARKILSKSRLASSKIQALARGVSVRQQQSAAAGAALVVQHSWRSHRFRAVLLAQLQLKFASATVIQSKWRSILVQKELWSKYRSAVKIQGRWRARRAQKLLLKSLLECAKLQAWVRGVSARRQLRVEKLNVASATTIQSKWRTYKIKYCSAVKIQGQWRACRAKKLLSKIRLGCTELQALVRGVSARRKLLAALAARAARAASILRGGWTRFAGPDQSDPVLLRLLEAFGKWSETDAAHQEFASLLKSKSKVGGYLTSDGRICFQLDTGTQTYCMAMLDKFWLSTYRTRVKVRDLPYSLRIHDSGDFCKKMIAYTHSQVTIAHGGPPQYLSLGSVFAISGPLLRGNEIHCNVTNPFWFQGILSLADGTLPPKLWGAKTTIDFPQLFDFPGWKELPQNVREAIEENDNCKDHCKEYGALLAGKEALEETDDPNGGGMDVGAVHLTRGGIYQNDNTQRSSKGFVLFTTVGERMPDSDEQWHRTNVLAMVCESVLPKFDSEEEKGSLLDMLRIAITTTCLDVTDSVTDKRLRKSSL